MRKDQIQMNQLDGNSHLLNHRPRQTKTLISNPNLLSNTPHLKYQIHNQTLAQISREKSKTNNYLNPDKSLKKPHQPIRSKNKNKEKVIQQHDKLTTQIHKMDEHKIPLEELINRLGTSLKLGLTTEVAIKRNLIEGDNKLPQKVLTPTWVKFLKQLSNWFSILLWVASILSIVAYILQPQGYTINLYLSFVLIFIIIFTGVMTYSQQKNQEDSSSGLENMLPSIAKVLRDGRLTQITVEKLVRGDIIEVTSGQKVPADIRIFSSMEMKVDNSPFTGELELLLRSPECTHPEDPFETRNLAFFGTMCKEGRGRGVVINIGENTAIGQISDLTMTEIQPKSSLRKQLDRFVLIITVITILLSVVFLLLSKFFVGYSSLQCIIFCTGILIANVPEGLLTCITISFAITAKKLADRHALVKNIHTIETLGSISCIISDKTGTITQNKLTVENLWYDGQVFRGHNKQQKGDEFEYQYDIQDPSFKTLHHTAIICSRAQFDVTEQQISAEGFKYVDARVIGDASQTALVRFYQPIEDILKTRSLYPFARKTDGSQARMLFDSMNKYALSIVRQEGNDHHYVAYINGAPDIVWKHCGRVLYQGKQKTIDAEENQKFKAANQKFVTNGERVQGYGMLPLSKQIFYQNFAFNTSSPDKFNFPFENLIFVGLISLMDPPKQSVPLAIKRCQSSSIKVIMVTGDQVSTAAAIAKKIGIISQKTNLDYQKQGLSSQEALHKSNAVVINGEMFAEAFRHGEEQGMEILVSWCQKPQIVFARTNSMIKLSIVKATQSLGYIVGATDDGYCSPAVKQADVGISMGICGSDVTKNAADMILLNDDFASIVDAVEQGRNFLDNLKKMVVYIMAGNMTKIMPFFALVFLQIPLPLSNIFMLCISIGTDIYPALSLIFEEPQFDVMTRKPRTEGENIITLRLLVHAYGQSGEVASFGGLFTYFCIMQVYGFPPSTLLFLLSNNVMLPVNTVAQFQNSTVNGENTVVPIYSFADPNSVNFQYTFNGNETQYDGTSPHINGHATGLGYFGSPMIASPQFICHPLNIHNAFTNDFPNWLSTINGKIDLRAFYVSCQYNTTSRQYQYKRIVPDQPQVLDTVSSYTDSPVAYTTEALFYAQSGYFATVVIMQWSNLFACKSRKHSFIYSTFNKHLLGSIVCSGLIVVILLYVPGINGAVGGRPLQFLLFGVPGLLFSMLLLCLQETRKMLMNLKTAGGNANWWAKNLLW